MTKGKLKWCPTAEIRLLVGSRYIQRSQNLVGFLLSPTLSNSLIKPNTHHSCVLTFHHLFLFLLNTLALSTLSPLLFCTFLILSIPLLVKEIASMFPYELKTTEHSNQLCIPFLTLHPFSNVFLCTLSPYSFLYSPENTYKLYQAQ